MCKSGIPLKDVKSSEWNYSGIYKITNIVNGIRLVNRVVKSKMN